jgi:hypothetical protein
MNKCSRTVCQSTKLTHRHTQTDRLYCARCAKKINGYAETELLVKIDDTSQKYGGYEDDPYCRAVIDYPNKNNPYIEDTYEYKEYEKGFIKTEIYG